MMREKLIEIYLDFTNNYLSVEKFAEHHGLYVDDALALLALARSVAEKPHPEE